MNRYPSACQICSLPLGYDPSSKSSLFLQNFLPPLASFVFLVRGDFLRKVVFRLGSWKLLFAHAFSSPTCPAPVFPFSAPALARSYRHKSPALETLITRNNIEAVVLPWSYIYLCISRCVLSQIRVCALADCSCSQAHRQSEI